MYSESDSTIMSQKVYSVLINNGKASVSSKTRLASEWLFMPNSLNGIPFSILLHFQPFHDKVSDFFTHHIAEIRTILIMDTPIKS